MVFALKVLLVVEAFIHITRAVRVTPEFSVDVLQKSHSETGTQEFSQVIAEEESKLRDESKFVMQNKKESEARSEFRLPNSKDLVEKKDSHHRELPSSSLQEADAYESGFISNETVRIPRYQTGRQLQRSNSLRSMQARSMPAALKRSNSMPGPTASSTRSWRGAAKAVVGTKRFASAFTAGNDIYATVKPSSPYSYEKFKKQFDLNQRNMLSKLYQAQRLNQIEPTNPVLVAIKKVQQFRACESDTTMANNPETKEMFIERWNTFQTAWPDARQAIQRALISEQKVNRVHVMENEIQTGRYFRTMNIVAQTFVLAVLLPSIDTLIRQSRRVPKIVFAGCGLGDWAVETLVEFGRNADVTCYNFNFPTMNDGRNLIRDATTAFDSSLSRSEVQYVQQNLHYLCSDNAQGCLCASGCGPSRTGFFTFELSRLRDELRFQFDAVIYGNALTPDETMNVVATTLADDTMSFAIIPVCSKRKPAAQVGQGAPCYCEGVYYKIFKSKVEGPLFKFGHVMRPWGTEGGPREPPCTVQNYDHSRLTRTRLGSMPPARPNTFDS